jgi:hypothetical protein
MKKITQTTLRLLWLCAFAAAIYWIAGPLPVGKGGGMGLLGVAGFWTQGTCVYWIVFGLFVGVFLASLMLAALLARQDSASRPKTILFAVVWGVPFGWSILGLFGAACEILGAWEEIAIRQSGESVSASAAIPVMVWGAATAIVSLVLFELSKRTPWRTLQRVTGVTLHVLVVATVLFAVVVNVFAKRDDPLPLPPWFLVRGSYTGILLGLFSYLWIARTTLARAGRE